MNEKDSLLKDINSINNELEDINYDILTIKEIERSEIIEKEFIEYKVSNLI